MTQASVLGLHASAATPAPPFRQSCGRWRPDRQSQRSLELRQIVAAACKGVRRLQPEGIPMLAEVDQDRAPVGPAPRRNAGRCRASWPGCPRIPCKKSMSFAGRPTWRSLRCGRARAWLTTDWPRTRSASGRGRLHHGDELHQRLFEPVNRAVRHRAPLRARTAPRPGRRGSPASFGALRGCARRSFPRSSRERRRLPCS